MNKKEIKYSPQFFLASLGNGGMAVAFFMYLNFLVPHKGYPMATFNHIYSLFSSSSSLTKSLLGIVMAGIAYFGYRHIKTLIWNINQFREFKNSDDYASLKNSKGALSLMILPLTFSMTLNVLFVIGAVFMPNLWASIEYLFPFALAGFALIGLSALKIFANYIIRYLKDGGFESGKTNSLSELIGSFAFAMVGVGLAGPAAMSHNLIVSNIAFILSIFFNALALGFLSIKIGHGIRNILNHGMDKKTSHTIWMIIPIFTLVGISLVRLTASISHNLLHTDIPAFFLFIGIGIIISIQGFFGIIGYKLMNENNYFESYVSGEEENPGSYGLICPGVAGFVLGMFFIGWGLIQTGIVTKYSALHFGLIIPLVFLQIKTIFTIKKLDNKYFNRSKIITSAQSAVFEA